MSFEKMKRDELYDMATKNFAVDVSEIATKQQIIAALAESGVTWDMARTFDANAAAVAQEEVLEEASVITTAAVKEVPVLVVERPVAPARPEVVVLRMDRENPTYQIRGYKFTRESPYAVVKSEDADFILSHEDGFKIASPREVQEYYG